MMKALKVYTAVLIFAVLAVAVTYPAKAQDMPIPNLSLSTVEPTPNASLATPDEMAKKHYDRCMAKPDSLWSHESQDRFCVCMTVQMLQKLTPEQMQELSEGKSTGALEPSDWAVKVYGPCLYNIAADIVRRECKTDRQLSYVLRTQPALDTTCDCLAAGAEIYFKNYAPAQLAALQKMNYSLLDPLDAIRRSADYMRDFQENKTACASKFQGLR